MRPSLADGLRWSGEGAGWFDQALRSLSEDALTEPSLLPQVSRAALLAHVAGSAGKLVEMIGQVEAGSIGVQPFSLCGAVLFPAAPVPADATAMRGLRARYHASAVDLARTYSSVAQAARDALLPIGPAGRTVASVPWLRARELMLHAVDLRGGVTFDDLPRDFHRCLITELADERTSEAGHPAVELRADTGDTWSIGEGGPVVTGPLCEISAYVAGRPASDLSGAAPVLPGWR